MRRVSTAVAQLIEQSNLSYFFTVEIEGLFYHTTLPQDITVGGKIFLTENGLVLLDAPLQSTIVDREVYKISYVDPNFDFRALFESGLVGTNVEVKVGFINTTDAILGGVIPGAPLTNSEDFLIVYAGVVDSHGVTSTEDSAVIAVIECSSPMASLGMKRQIFTTKEATSQFSTTDTAYDQIYFGARGINLLWGKA